MIPFFGMGIDQLAESKFGKPETEDNEVLIGDDGTKKKAESKGHIKCIFVKLRFCLLKLLKNVIKSHHLE